MGRCFGDGDPLYTAYHDSEWGRPIHEERALLELLCLEGFQAGLSWPTILRRRETLRPAFAGFEPEALAGFTGGDVDRLLADPGVIRHRGKIEAAISNARATLALRTAGTPLPHLVWSFQPVPRPAPQTPTEVPAQTPASAALSLALRQKGFRFVGPTTAHALMQAAGIVNDHLAECPTRQVVGLGRR